MNEPTSEEIEEAMLWFSSSGHDDIDIRMGKLIAAAYRSSQEKLEAQVGANKVYLEMFGKERKRAEEAEAKLARADKMEAAWHAKVLRLQGELVEAKKDLESGFMQGAYARLKSLQESEREMYALKEKLEKLTKQYGESVSQGTVWWQERDALQEKLREMTEVRDAVVKHHHKVEDKLRDAEKLIDKARASLQIAISGREDARKALQEVADVMGPLIEKCKSLQAERDALAGRLEKADKLAGATEGACRCVFCEGYEPCCGPCANGLALKKALEDYRK